MIRSVFNGKEDKTMKRIAFGLLTLALTLVACNKNDIDLSPVDNNVETNEGIPFTATISAGDNVVTRALTESGNTLVATWAVGEKVALVHNSRKDEMTVSEVNDGVATITGTITGWPATGDAVTIFYPSTAAEDFPNEITGEIGLKDDVLDGQNGQLTGAGSIAEKYDVRKGSGTLKVSGGTATLDGNVSLTNQFAIFKFTVCLYHGDEVNAFCPVLLRITIGSDTYTITADGWDEVLYVALPAVDGKKVIFDAEDDRGEMYTCAKLNTTFAAGKFYQTRLKMRQCVLMGEGYNLRWAVCNMGFARQADDYGDYYAWGATATQTTYDWAHYPFMQAGQNDFNHINKYTIADGWKDGIWYSSDTFIGDGKTSFADYDYVDDVARQQWGGTWHIPTEEEWQALKNPENFIWTWKTDYNCKKGMLVTSKVPGYSGNQIFLPAAGCYEGSSINLEGAYGYYWSSSLSNYTMSARYFGISSSGTGGGQIYRHNGCSVRAVAE